MDRKTMMGQVTRQLAIDYNCAPEDFSRDGLIFTQAEAVEGRRPFPLRSPRLELVTMGNGVVVNASAKLLPQLRRRLAGKPRDEVFSLPFVCGINRYFLPDLGNIPSLALPSGYSYELVEQQAIPALYQQSDAFHFALQYDLHSQRPDVLAMAARDQGALIGVAGASADCGAMWQIGVDVVPSHRGRGLAAALVNHLTQAILERSVIPYYCVASSNVASARAAVRAGYLPAWVHCYNTKPGFLRW